MDLKILKTTTVNGKIVVMNKITYFLVSLSGFLICFIVSVFGYWNEINFESILKHPISDPHRLFGLLFVFAISLWPGAISAIIIYTAKINFGNSLKLLLLLFLSLMLLHLFLSAGKGAQGAIYVIAIPTISCLIQVLSWLFLVRQ